MIASFPGLPRPSHHPFFDCFLVCKNGGGRLSLFDHMNDVLSTKVDRGGGGVSDQKTSLRPYLVHVAAAPSTDVRKVKNVPFLVQTCVQNAYF